MNRVEASKFSADELLAEYERKTQAAFSCELAETLDAVLGNRKVLRSELQRRLYAAELLADHCQRMINSCQLPVSEENELRQLLSGYRGPTK